MKINHLYRFLFFTSFIFSTTHAQTIAGKVLSNNNEPIPYATIQIGNDYGVITNEEGNFSILTEGFSEDEQVKISCLGYESIDLKLKTFTSQSYILKEHYDELSEVFLTNKNLSVEDILQKVQENISSNYSTNFEGEIYYRNTSFNTPKKLDFEILKASELKKSFIKTLNSRFENLKKLSENYTSSNYSDVLLNYSKLNDSSKANVIKATKLINEAKDKSSDKLSEEFINLIGKQLDSGATYKVKTGLLKIEDSLKFDMNVNSKKKDSLQKTKHLIGAINSLSKKHNIHEDSQFSFLFNYKKNNYILEEITYINNEPVYVISFTPKKKSELFEGVFYVNTSDFAVIKIDYKLGENRFGERLNLKALIGIKFVENNIEGSVLYSKGNDNYYTPFYIKRETQAYLYFSRPFKFIKNLMNKDDEKKVFKFKFKIESNTSTKSEVYFINNKPNSEMSFQNFNNVKTYSEEKIKTYNPETWKDYNILAPVEAIKNYHLDD